MENRPLTLISSTLLSKTILSYKSSFVASFNLFSNLIYYFPLYFKSY